MISSIASSNPYANSSVSSIGIPLKLNTGLLCILPFGVINTVATVLITPKGNIHKRPVLSFRGIPIEDTDEFAYGLEDAIEEITRTFKLGSKQQEHNLIDALKIACRKFSKEKTGKKPFTNINLVRI